MAGWCLGGPVGIGTLIVALFLGQVVHMTLPFAQKWLQKCIAKQQTVAS